MSDYLYIVELKERLPKLDYNIRQIESVETAEKYYQQIGVVFGRARKRYEELKLAQDEAIVSGDDSVIE